MWIRIQSFSHSYLPTFTILTKFKIYFLKQFIIWKTLFPKSTGTVPYAKIRAQEERPELRWSIFVRPAFLRTRNTEPDPKSW